MLQGFLREVAQNDKTSSKVLKAENFAVGSKKWQNSDSGGCAYVAGIFTQSGTKWQKPLLEMKKQEILQWIAKNDKIQNL